MKAIFAFLVLSVSLQAYAQDNKTHNLKSTLLEELRSTHNVAGWFAPANTAVQGLTAEQASWKPKDDEHSIGQLANHILFWDRRNLEKFKGEPLDKYAGNNDETFNSFDSKSWAATVQQLDAVMTEWEKAVEAADDKKVESWAPTIANIATHNAYHIGQIIFIRKLQGSWDPAKGVK
jgi:uncharacterized damage-inducible protein DinB